MAYSKLPIGDKAPELVNCVIEIPEGGSVKYEYDEELDEIKLDRMLYGAMYYPANYGFIPKTRSEDGDHLDVMVVTSAPLVTGCVVEARPIGVLDMEDEEGRDWKIIAVAKKDPYFQGMDSIDQLNDHLKKKIANFFEVYKTLQAAEGKWVKVKNWSGRDEAHRLIKQAAEKFAKEKHKAS